MKLFLIGWAESNPELIDAAEALAQHGHRIIYWVRNDPRHNAAAIPVDATRFPHTIFHSYYDASRGIPSDSILCDKFPYPDPQFLASLSLLELQVVSMMGKLYPATNVAERRQLFIRFVRYWLGVLEQLKPDVIFFNTTPHNPFYFVLYGIAEQKHIRTLMFDLTWVSDRLVWMPNYHDGSVALHKEYLRLQRLQPSLADLPLDIRLHYERHINPAIDTTPLYTTEGLAAYHFFPLLWRKIRRLFSLFFQPKLLRERLRWAYIQFPTTLSKLTYRFRSNLPRTYNALQVAPDFTKKFIYVPLHFQPECSTNPIGDVFQDQIFLIQKLSENLPKDWVIYVKEHPFQWLPYGVGFIEDRYQLYYHRIAEIPRVFLVPMTAHSLDFVTRAEAVATVSGTAGWEAILRGKPALIFGYPWYQHAPGVFRVHTSAEVLSAMQAIQQRVVISPSDTRAFLLALHQASFHGYLDTHTQRVSSLTQSENMQSFLQAFLKALQ